MDLMMGLTPGLDYTAHVLVPSHHKQNICRVSTCQKHHLGATACHTTKVRNQIESNLERRDAEQDKLCIKTPVERIEYRPFKKDENVW
jgi:hypothetical protein